MKLGCNIFFLLTFILFFLNSFSTAEEKISSSPPTDAELIQKFHNFQSFYLPHTKSNKYLFAPVGSFSSNSLLITLLIDLFLNCLLCCLEINKTLAKTRLSPCIGHLPFNQLNKREIPQLALILAPICLFHAGNE